MNSTTCQALGIHEVGNSESEFSRSFDERCTGSPQVVPDEALLGNGEGKWGLRQLKLAEILPV